MNSPKHTDCSTGAHGTEAATEPLNRGNSQPQSHSYTAPEIAAIVFPDPDPILLYAERGMTFDVVGKMKKGKTTFILLGCRAVLRGERFLDRARTRG